MNDFHILSEHNHLGGEKKRKNAVAPRHTDRDNSRFQNCVILSLVVMPTLSRPLKYEEMSQNEPIKKREK
jgi:hypothetical protein